MRSATTTCMLPRVLVVLLPFCRAAFLSGIHDFMLSISDGDALSDSMALMLSLSQGFMFSRDRAFIFRCSQASFEARREGALMRED